MSLRSLSLFAALVCSGTAWAAPPPPPPPPEQAPLLPAPPRFEGRVQDPMLAPMPPAEAQVDSWEDALVMMRERSTDLRIAEAAVVQAEGRWRQALGALLPNVQANAGVAVDLLNPSIAVIAGGGSVGAIAGGSAGTATPTVPLVSGSVSLTQSLVDVSAWRGIAGASALEGAARASLQDVQRRLTQGLASALVAAVASERASELNRVGLAQALERYALAQRSFELGASNQLDVVRVAQDVAVAREALVSGDEHLRRVREALGLTLGRDIPVGVGPAFHLDGLLVATGERCAPLEVVTDRSDLVALRSRVKAAEASRGQAAAGYLPRLGLQSSAFGLTTQPGPGRVLNWSLAAVISVPLWEGGSRAGLVREREGVVRQTSEQLEQSSRNVTVEIARSRRSVSVAESLVRTAVEGRELAERTDQLTRRAFEVGRGSSLELVQSGAALRRAELLQALREFELVQARLDSFLTEAQCDW